jgi:AbrB family looped-hinge helix DNA binding protein
MTTTVSSKGQMVLPVALRQQDDIRAGQEFDVERIQEGEYLLKRRTRRRNQGLVTLLLQCPVKGWFKAPARTDSTDDIALPTLG